jgi:hypothetical protein
MPRTLLPVERKFRLLTKLTKAMEFHQRRWQRLLERKRKVYEWRSKRS